MRRQFQDCATTETLWWSRIRGYHACLTELGFYASEPWLSREIHRVICGDASAPTELRFPDLPVIASFTESRAWAKELRAENPKWVSEVDALKNDLSSLFLASLQSCCTPDKNLEQYEIDAASRRLRFAANRLGILGLESIHEELTH